VLALATVALAVYERDRLAPSTPRMAPASSAPVEQASPPRFATASNAPAPTALAPIVTPELAEVVRPEHKLAPRPVHVRAHSEHTHARTAAPTPPVSTPTEMGWLSVNAVPWGAVLIDGHKVADDTPLYRLPVLAGRHRVSVVSPSRATPSPEREVRVQPGETRSVSITW
jgi:hypothetical protein